MELLDGSPENISKLELVDLEQIAATHYNEKLSDENRQLKLERDATHRRLETDSNQKIKRWKENITRAFEAIVFTAVFGVLIFGVVGTIVQFVCHNGFGLTNITLLLFGLVGICDAIFPRFRFINRLIAIASNKFIQIIEKKENECIRKILGIENEQ